MGNIMKYLDFLQALKEIKDSGNHQEFVSSLERMMKTMDELDLDDYFGSEGWKEFFGLE